VSNLSSTAAARLRTLNFRLRLNLISRFVTRTQTANGYPNFKTPVETSTTPRMLDFGCKYIIIILQLTISVKAN